MDVSTDPPLSEWTLLEDPAKENGQTQLGTQIKQDGSEEPGMSMKQESRDSSCVRTIQEGSKDEKIKMGYVEVKCKRTEEDKKEDGVKDEDKKEDEEKRIEPKITIALYIKVHGKRHNTASTAPLFRSKKSH